MSAYVALLRGINVGGAHALPMKDLVAMLQGLGARNVRTYIQSGNAVFHSAAKNSSVLARRIASEIKKRRGFEPGVLVLKSDAVEQAIANNPFPDAASDASRLHLGFLLAKPKEPDVAGLERMKNAGERYRLIGSVFYLHAPEGIGRSKLAANLERLLGVAVTNRNWRTVCKLRDMATA